MVMYDPNIFICYSADKDVWNLCKFTRNIMTNIVAEVNTSDFVHVVSNAQRERCILTDRAAGS